LKEISQELADYIRKNYPKVKVKPTVHKFYIEETKENRLIISQFTKLKLKGVHKTGI